MRNGHQAVEASAWLRRLDFWRDGSVNGKDGSGFDLAVNHFSGLPSRWCVRVLQQRLARVQEVGEWVPRCLPFKMRTVKDSCHSRLVVLCVGSRPFGFAKPHHIASDETGQLLASCSTRLAS
jgi:hypothetical protein